MSAGRSGAARKRCVVAFATRERQHLWHLELPAHATIGEALQAACAACADPLLREQVPWSEAPLGVFGEPRQRAEQFADGDRIELYRPLRRDPRTRRRERVARERAAGGGARRGG